MQAALETLHSLVNDGHKVLVHCAAGTRRAPFTVAFYLATYENVGFKKALEFVAEKRPFVGVTPALLLLTDLL